MDEKTIEARVLEEQRRVDKEIALAKFIKGLSAQMWRVGLK